MVQATFMKFLIEELMHVRDPESDLTLLALRGGALLSEASLTGHF